MSVCLSVCPSTKMIRECRLAKIGPKGQSKVSLTKIQEMEHKSKTKDNTNTFTFAPPVKVQGHQGCAYKRRFEFGLDTPVNPDRLDAPVNPDRLWMMRRFSNLEKQLWEIQVDIRRRKMLQFGHKSLATSLLWCLMQFFPTRATKYLQKYQFWPLGR